MNHLHLFLKIILRFQNRPQAKTDFVALARATYLEKNQTRLIDKFKKNYSQYNKKDVLNWYTKDCFLFKLINNCLRVATSDSILYCRLLLKDLEQAIKEQYQAKSKNFSRLLYRGAYLSDQEWSNLKQNLGREIEMHGFLSTSKSQNTALNFMHDDPDQKVFITIIVPKGPNDEEQGFAEIAEFSEFPEEEILFNVRSRFTVLETENKHSPGRAYRHLVLLYGAQGFRKFLAEQDATHHISIPRLEKSLCTLCKGQPYQKDAEIFFLSLQDLKKHSYFCQRCFVNLPFETYAPLLCVPVKGHSHQEAGIYRRKIEGFLLKGPKKIPFYGYTCDKCQAKKQKLYFKCMGCNQRKWCTDCIESISDCIKAGHAVILENGPFSFWCEKMNESEKRHLKFHEKMANSFIFQQAQMYLESHQYQRVIDYFLKYIEKNKNTKKDDRLAIAYHQIANVYDRQGEEKKALEYYSKSLEIRKSLHGKNDDDVVHSFNNMGNVYFRQGEYAKALKYYSKSLKIRKSIYKDNHSDIASSYNNIGSVYSSQGDYMKALKYHSKSLEIRKSIHGENDPGVACSYCNLATAYCIQGEYEKTFECYSKSLEILKSIYGNNHPHVASSYYNLALVYESQGEDNKALGYYSESLEIRTSIFGKDHPQTKRISDKIKFISKKLIQ